MSFVLAVVMAMHMKVDEGFITTPDGVKLHYRKTGHGPTTIVVPLEHLLWDEMSKLADHATVICYDMRSRGRSSRTEAISIQNDAADLETVRKHFNLDRFVPVGYSYLGMMVALYARDHPNRVERLVHPVYLELLLRRAGFTAVDIDAGPASADYIATATR